LAAKNLLLAAQLVNQAVGDAISVFLFVEVVLYLKNWSISQWNRLYTDLSSKQIKLPVQDRSIIVCNDDETIALSPPGLQAQLDIAMSTIPNSRCFVRPSGTEDVVRVYAEAETKEQANQLAILAAQAVYDIAGGINTRPS